MDGTRLPRLATFATLCRCALVCGAAALMASCGLQRTPAHGEGGQPGKPVAATNRPVDVTPRCSSTDLSVKLDVHAVGVAAGTSYIPLDFTNLSSARCRLAPFPVVTLAVSKTGKPIGTAPTDDRSTPAQSLVLGGGRTAHVWLHLLDVANLPTATCHPVTAAGLLVRLPGQQRAIFVSHRLTACANAVHGTDIVTIEPFQAGRAKPGTAQ